MLLQHKTLFSTILKYTNNFLYKIKLSHENRTPQYKLINILSSTHIYLITSDSFLIHHLLNCLGHFTIAFLLVAYWGPVSLITGNERRVYPGADSVTWSPVSSSLWTGGFAQTVTTNHDSCILRGRRLMFNRLLVYRQPAMSVRYAVSSRTCYSLSGIGNNTLRKYWPNLPARIWQPFPCLAARLREKIVLN